MTKRDGKEYMTYLAKVKANPLSGQVKLVDLYHNLNFTRLNKITEVDKARIKKYLKAIDCLLLSD